MIQLISEAVSKPLIHRRIEALAAKLRRRQLIGSHDVATEVVKLIREVVAGAKFDSFETLMGHILEVGKALQYAGPKELVVTNMIERIRADLSEEYATALKNYLATNSSANSLSSYPTTPFTPFDSTTGLGGSFFPERTGSLGNMFDLLGHKSPSSHTHHSHHSSSGASINPTPAPSAPSSPSRATPGLPTRKASMPGTGTSPEVSAMLTAEFSQKSYTLKPVFIEAIQELLDEVDMSYRAVGEQSWEHIHSGEFILTIGQSRTVEAFLKAAARKRQFTVIVAETAPSFSGRATALSLAAAGLTTILIPDSSIFSLLPRCSKVLLGPHLIAADGSLLSISGSLPLCIAANKMRVPVVVVGGMYKFCTTFLTAEDWGMRDLGSPEEVLDFGIEGGRDGEAEGEETEVLNPFWDVVPAELVSLYITNFLDIDPRELPDPSSSSSSLESDYDFAKNSRTTSSCSRQHQFSTAKMHLMFSLNPDGTRLYSLKKTTATGVTQSAHPARFSPDDKFSRHRVTIKKRNKILLTQLPSRPL